MASKLVTDCKQLKAGMKVWLAHMPAGQRAWRVQAGELVGYGATWIHRGIEKEVLFMHVAGACPACTEFPALQRSAEGVWIHCPVCFGGYL